MSLNTDKITLKIALFGIFDLTWKSVVGTKIKDFQFEDLSTDKKLSTITLMEELKPIFMEKNDLEYWDKSKMLSFLALWIMGIRTQGSRSMTFSLNCPP